MNRWISIVAILVVGVGTINAEVVQREVNEVTNEVVDNKIGEQIVTPYISRDLWNTVLQEQNLSYLIKEGEQGEPTLQEVAYAVCKMLKEPGIYLPEAERIGDPYISKLILLGIWQEDEVGETSLVTSEAWERTYERVVHYYSSPSPFPRGDSKAEQKMATYRQKITKMTSYEAVEIGKLTKSTQVLICESNTYPIYHFSNTSYIDLTTLEALGFNIKKEDKDYVMDYVNPSRPLNTPLEKQSIAVSLGNESIYYGYLKTYVLKGGDSLFIPLRALEQDFQLQVETEGIKLGRSRKAQSFLTYEQGRLINQSNTPIEVITTSYYWDGKHMYEEVKKEHLEAGEGLEAPGATYILRGAYYITTLINAVETQEGSYKEERTYGQKIENLLVIYEQAKLAQLEKDKEGTKQEVTIEELFPSTPVYAILKGAIIGAAKGEQVEIYSEDNGSYTVITKIGKKVTVSRSKLKILADKKVTVQPVTKAQIEGYINTQNISSQTEYLVWTDLHRQNTYILKGGQNQWELVKRMLCSTGKNVTPTPRGFFTLLNKVPSFGQEKGYCCKNAYGFIGSSYLYHSVLFDKTGSYIISGKKELGQKASQGCIRLSPEDSEWFYATLPKGTKVWVN